MSKPPPLGQADYRLGFGESGEYERPSMSSKRRPTGLKPAKPRKISGWSRSTGGRGCSGTVTSGLANFTGCAAGRPRFSIRVCAGRSRSVRSTRRSRPRRRRRSLHDSAKRLGIDWQSGEAGCAVVVATGLESDDPRESADYWRLRLVERKYTRPTAWPSRSFPAASSTTVPAAISRSARSTRCRRRSRRWRCTGVSSAGAGRRRPGSGGS